MIDVEGTQLCQQDIELLAHPLVGGVILFSRNYADKVQLCKLVKQIKSIRKPELLVCVDQEGGRVQRFKTDFSELPDLHSLGRLYDHDPEQALKCSRYHARLMAQELKPTGIDFSFAPVVDLFDPDSHIIANRAFHHDPDVIGKLANAYIAGLHDMGMIAVGKHFPGHGGVIEDSHLCLPEDKRCFSDLKNQDMLPYQFLISRGLDALMSAHVLFNQIDSLPSGFSSFWIKTILRKQLGFSGVVFTDDLSMQGAVEFGGVIERTHLALNAGCDIALICNDRAAVESVLDDSRLLKLIDSSANLHQRCRRTATQDSVLDQDQIQALVTTLKLQG